MKHNTEFIFDFVWIRLYENEEACVRVRIVRVEIVPAWRRHSGDLLDSWRIVSVIEVLYPAH